MNWKTIFNPFEKYDEKTLLSVGVVFFIFNIAGCYYSESVNDSIFHLSLLDKPFTIWDILKINVLSSILAIGVLFILAMILNSKTRIIDISNTVLISQIPLIVTMPFMSLPFYKSAMSNLAQNAGNPMAMEINDLIIVTAGAFATLPLLVYSFVLFYNGFRTATNIRKWQHIVLFVFISFLLTIFSQILL